MDSTALDQIWAISFLGFMSKLKDGKALILNLNSRAWEDCGLVWSKSWNEYKIFLKRWNGNYKVTTQPYYKDFMDRKWFTAKIMSIAKQEGDVLYKIELDFSAEGGM